MIRNPFSNGRVPDEGMEVVKSSYWQRLSRDGDVTLEEVNPVVLEEPEE